MPQTYRRLIASPGTALQATITPFSPFQLPGANAYRSLRLTNKRLNTPLSNVYQQYELAGGSYESN